MISLRKANLSQGEKNNCADVLELQEYLKKLAAFHTDFPLVVADGVYGEQTAHAVSLFQQGCRLSETGKVDHATWDALCETCQHFTDKQTPPRAIPVLCWNEQTLCMGGTGDSVYLLQIMLARLSRRFVNLPTPPVTGCFDTTTAEAIDLFISLCGLPETKGVSKHAWDLLTAVYRSCMD